MRKQVGAFRLENGSVIGPADYMKERGAARILDIENGTDVCCNVGVRETGDIETSVLVSLQTDYAAWLGEKELTQCFQ